MPKQQQKCSHCNGTGVVPIKNTRTVLAALRKEKQEWIKKTASRSQLKKTGYTDDEINALYSEKKFGKTRYPINQL